MSCLGWRQGETGGFAYHRSKRFCIPQRYLFQSTMHRRHYMIKINIPFQYLFRTRAQSLSGLLGANMDRVKPQFRESLLAIQFLGTFSLNSETQLPSISIV